MPLSLPFQASTYLTFPPSNIIFLLQICLTTFLCINCEYQGSQQRPLNSPWASPWVQAWVQAWGKMSPSEKGQCLAFTVPYLSLALQVMLRGHMSTDTCLGFFILGCTAFLVFIFWAQDSEVPSLAQLFIELEALVNLSMESLISEQTIAMDQTRLPDQIGQQILDSTATVQNADVDRKRYISPKTSFSEDLAEEIRLRNAQKLEEKALLQGACNEPLFDKTTEEAVYEDVDLHSSDSDTSSETDSEWSVIA